MKSTGLVLGIGLALVAASGCGGSTDNAGASKAGSGGNPGSGGATGGNSGTGGSTGGNSGTGGSTGGNSGTGGSGGIDAGSCNTACSTPMDCTLAPINCCICGEAKLSDYQAVNKASASTCGCGGPICQCASMPNPNLAATCTAGACTAFDVSAVDTYSACQIDADCHLRIGLGCCELCQSNGYDLVAVNGEKGALTAALCGTGPVGCPGCIPSYPPDKKAVCVANHCQVQ